MSREKREVYDDQCDLCKRKHNKEDGPVIHLTSDKPNPTWFEQFNGVFQLASAAEASWNSVDEPIGEEAWILVNKKYIVCNICLERVAKKILIPCFKETMKLHDNCKQDRYLDLYSNLIGTMIKFFKLRD